MPTIGSMMRQTNTILRMANKPTWATKTSSYNSTFGTSSLGQTSTLFGSGTLSVNTDYISSVLSSRTSLNSILSDYSAGKSAFQSEFKEKMSSLGKAANSLKNFSQTNASAGSKTAAAKQNKSATDAANSISSFMSQKTNASATVRRELNDHLSTVKNFANNASSLGADGKKNAQSALGRIQNIMENHTGVTQKQALAAKDDAHTVNALTDNYQSIHNRITGNAAQSVINLQSIVDEYKETGAVSSAKSLTDSANAIKGAAGEVESFYNAVDSLQGFTASYNMDAGRSSELTNAMENIQSMAASQGVSRDTLSSIGSAVDTISKLASGEDVSHEALDAAMSSLSNFLTEYKSALQPDEATLNSWKESASTISGIANETATPYEELSTLQSTVNVQDGKTEDATTNAIESGIKERLTNVKDFVKEFNSTMDYLNENKDISARFSSLASSFNDNSYFRGSLDKVGISVGKDGTLSVDEAKLTKALTDNPSSVDAVLGKDGLAGRLDRKINMANQQVDKLFPSVTNFVGSNSISATKSMYSAHTLGMMSNYNNAGNLLTMFS